MKSDVERTKEEIDALWAQIEKVRLTLGTAIAWLRREYGDEGMRQLLDMLGSGRRTTSTTADENVYSRGDTPITDAACVSREFIEREMDRYTQKFVLAGYARKFERENAELRKRLERLEWQPIETAPRDGTPILLYSSDDGCHQGCWFDGRDDTGWCTDGLFSNDWTHWKPLEPPSDAEDRTK